MRVKIYLNILKLRKCNNAMAPRILTIIPMKFKIFQKALLLYL